MAAQFLSLAFTVLVAQGSLAQDPVTVHPRLKLIGVILDEGRPLTKSVVVLRDEASEQTFTLVGQAPIPNTDELRLKTLGRGFVIVANKERSFRVNHLEVPDTEQEAVVDETNALDDIDPTQVAVSAEVAWMELEKRAKKHNLKLIKRIKPGELRPAKKEVCEEEPCTTDPEDGVASPELPEEQSSETTEEY